MSSILNNSLMHNWLIRDRKIEWELALLSYLDDQGEKWGDSYIKIISQHFDNYAHWDSISTLLPVSGNLLSRSVVPSFVPILFSSHT